MVQQSTLFTYIRYCKQISSVVYGLYLEFVLFLPPADVVREKLGRRCTYRDVTYCWK